MKLDFFLRISFILKFLILTVEFSFYVGSSVFICYLSSFLQKQISRNDFTISKKFNFKILLFQNLTYPSLVLLNITSHDKIKSVVNCVNRLKLSCLKIWLTFKNGAKQWWNKHGGQIKNGGKLWSNEMAKINTMAWQFCRIRPL